MLLFREANDSSELSRSEHALVRERFISALKSSDIRQKLRAMPEVEFDVLVRKARALRKSFEFE